MSFVHSARIRAENTRPAITSEAPSMVARLSFYSIRLQELSLAYFCAEKKPARFSRFLVSGLNRGETSQHGILNSSS
ncbi:MAG: hypothetical protein NTW32_14335 [Chloroflexi bacterium]|nr:hypothetical protein [Chloroflexota bacterium]